MRHGLGVAHADHAAYLAAIGLEPEVDTEG